MTPSFSVRTSTHFDRLLKSLARGNQEVIERYAEAIEVLSVDPYNRSRRHDILKLQGVAAGDGQYRLRLGRWRFRYDISGQDVVLHYCGLRREDTYQ
jgi:mRNA-degrading endonuclease RelE of RelBE toxin-antitoxin system